MEENGNLSKEERTKDLDENIDDRITTLEEKLMCNNLLWKGQLFQLDVVDEKIGSLKSIPFLVGAITLVLVTGGIVGKVLAPMLLISGTLWIPTITFLAISLPKAKKERKKHQQEMEQLDAESKTICEKLKKAREKRKELEQIPEYRIEKTKSAVENFKKIINQDFEDILGISYDEYQKLSPEEQQQLIKDFHAKKDNLPIIDDSKEELPPLTVSDKELSEKRKAQIIETISEAERLMAEERGENKGSAKKIPSIPRSVECCIFPEEYTKEEPKVKKLTRSRKKNNNNNQNN